MEEDKMPTIVGGSDGGGGGSESGHSNQRIWAAQRLSSEGGPIAHHLEERRGEGLMLSLNHPRRPPHSSGGSSCTLPPNREFLLKDSRGKSYSSSPFSYSYCRSSSFSSFRSNSSGVFWGMRWPLPLRTLWVCCLWVLFTTPTNTCADSNGCDFYGSGLEQDGRGVQPVYLSCSSGRVEWQYPRAGLRVILKSPYKDKEFHACIKGDSKFEGARIYLEGHRSLLPLFAADDGRPNDLVRCFTSYKGQAALYVEAEQSNNDLKKQVAAFEYDLQILSKGAVYDPLEECRPCSEEELLRLYCSADFVARGTIVAVEDDTRMSRTTITIQATKLFQQTSPVFRYSSSRKGSKLRGPSHKMADQGSLQEEDEEGQELMGNTLMGEASYMGRIDVPIECGAKAGEGEFLIMGVMRLGQPILRCAPRHAEWVKIAKTAHSRAQCVIET